MVAVFAYGTLQVPAVFEAVTGQSHVSESAELQDFARYCIRGQVFPGIIPESGASVSGRYYASLDASALAALDAFEDTLYVRQPVTITVNDEPHQAQAYVVAERYHSWLDQRPWSLDEFIDRHLAKYLRSCYSTGG